jgi:hypothetical protein
MKGALMDATMKLRDRVRQWLGIDVQAIGRCVEEINVKLDSIAEVQDRMAARVDRALNLTRDKAHKVTVVDWEQVQAMHLAPEYQNDPKEKH